MQKIRTYTGVLKKEPEGGYTVTVPALPGCIAYGEDVDEAILMAEKAVELYIEELKAKRKTYKDKIIF